MSGLGAVAATAAATALAAVAHADDGPPPGDGILPPPRNVVVDLVNQQHDNPKGQAFYSQGAYEAWCADFVSWVLNQTGNPVHGRYGWREPTVAGMEQQFASRGQLESRDYAPRPGDAVLYGHNHINFVVSVDGDNIVTVGGNEINGGISRRTINRHDGRITGFGRTSDHAVVQDVPQRALEDGWMPPEGVRVSIIPEVVPNAPSPEDGEVMTTAEIPPAQEPFIPAPEFVPAENFDTGAPPPPPDQELPPPPAPEPFPAQPAAFEAPPPPPPAPEAPPPPWDAPPPPEPAPAPQEMAAPAEPPLAPEPFPAYAQPPAQEMSAPAVPMAPVIVDQQMDAPETDRTDDLQSIPLSEPLPPVVTPLPDDQPQG